MLDEGALVDEVLERVVGDEMVVLAVSLARARRTRGVWGLGNVAVREGGTRRRDVRETLKPNLSG